MAERKFTVIHGDATFDVEYNTADGLEVFKFQLFSLTSIPPDEQKIVRSDDNSEIIEDTDLISCLDKLKLVSMDDQVSTKPESSTSTSPISQDATLTDEALARMLQAEEEALLFQQYLAGENKQEIEQRIRPYIDQVMMYEDPSYQEAARKTVPIDELEEKALVSIAKKEGNFEPSKAEQDHAFLLELLFWFKQSFSWVNAPPCDGCGNQTQHQGMGVAVAEEIRWGGSRVELYRCSSCSRITRFPRYNHPLKLLETRKGRCGEWANCFTFYCRAFGYDSRLVIDFTDHVWTECYSNHLERWMHLDPCEGIYDNPLLYEKGWKKKLNYVFGISKDGICDVTKRYTRKWHEVLTRRNLTTEPVLSSTIANITKQCRRNYKPELIAMLEACDKSEEEALERILHSKDDAAVSLPGRLSGDKQWRLSRSEYGSDDSNSLSLSSCPVRLCVDEHVTKIYDAFGVIMSQLVDSSFSVPQGIDLLKSFKEIMMDFKKSPFRSRRTTIKNSDDQKAILCRMLPAFNALLHALHLTCHAANGDMVLSLAGDPVKTSLALPVAFDALDDMINSLDKCTSIRTDLLCLPLLRLNRIHSGSVLASGEELPFGIATSAFDGLRLSKWEEPNGAKGGWIAYKLKDEQACELVGYELMSANDAPERDPMDWIVEGSNDEGSNWHILDKQTSQVFESRFQRKMYKIKHSNTMSNVIRFKFLAVRDVESNSRLQIGNIDLYARKN